MAYVPQTWNDNAPPAATAARLGYIEAGVQAAAAGADTAVAAVALRAAQIVQAVDLSWPARSTVGVASTAVVIWVGKSTSPPAVGGVGMGVNDLFFALP